MQDKCKHLVITLLVLIGPFTTLWSQTANGETNITESWEFWLKGVAIFGGLAALVGYFFKKSVDAGVQSRINKIENKLDRFELQAEERIKSVQEEIIAKINGPGSTINLILDKTSEEQALLATKKIYLWGDQNIVNLSKILRIVGFNMENLIIGDPGNESYDILFINNEMGTFSPKADPDTSGPGVKRDFSSIEKVINDHLNRKDVCIFYYNTNQAYLPLHQLDFDLQHRINFATNPSQIYGNLMNSLKYQERLKREVAR